MRMEEGQRNPYPTVDLIIEVDDSIVLVKRKNPPYGWAIPGGFVDTGERAEDAAIREAWEETGLSVTLTDLLGVYSDPQRDPRFHTLSVVYIGTAEGTPVAGDDAGEVGLFQEDTLPDEIAFDHREILRDYFTYKKTGRHPPPRPKNSRGA